MATYSGRRGKQPADPSPFDRAALAEHAAQLGVTPERVLAELALIAFADLGRIAEWGPGWFRMKDSVALAKEDSAAISEIVPAAGGNGACRVKLFDKKAALDALARHFRMYERPIERHPEGKARETAEDPREFIVRRLADLAAGAGEGRSDPQPSDGPGDRVPARLEGLGAA